MSSNAPETNDPSSGKAQSTQRRGRRPATRLTGRKLTAPPVTARIRLNTATDKDPAPAPRPLLKPTHGVRFIFSEEDTATGTQLRKREVTLDLRDKKKGAAAASSLRDDADDTVLGDDPSFQTATDDQPGQDRSSRGKSQQEYLQEFLMHRKDLLGALLGSHASPTTTQCQNCNVTVGRWRCRDCYLQPLLCRGCCRRGHGNLPFHRVERWTGKYFHPSHLWEVGLRLCIPHAGETCEHLVRMTGALEREEQEKDNLEQEAITQRPQYKGKGKVGGADPHAAPVSADDGEWAHYYRWKESGSMQVDGDNDDDNLPDLMSVDNDSDVDSVVGREDGEPPVSRSTRIFAEMATEDESTFVEDPGDDADWEDMEDTERLPGDPLQPGVPHKDAFDLPFIVVVDSSGVHHLPLLSCGCRGSAQTLTDAMAVGLLPSSFKEIKSLFTIACLDEFRLANLECKTSAYQYYQMLRRRTIPGNPTAVPNRYAEFRRASREWRHLKKLMEHGVGHTMKQPSTGELAHFCPACPQPGINLPAAEEESQDGPLPPRSFVVDGNFTADHLKQKRPEDDVWLLNGQGMITGRQGYQEHLKVAIEKRTNAPCERNFNAIDQANRSSTTNDVTGIVAVACARHGCFAPGSVADLQKGERQMNVDWAFAEAIRNTHVPPHSKVHLLYDIYCQWSIHWAERMRLNPHLTLPPGIEVDGGIGLFHVHGHREECLYRYATYFVPGAAVVDGEVLERLWSVLNLVSRSTRTATLAHRAEILDDHMNDNNWKKMIGIVPVICKRYEKAVVSAQETAHYFHTITQSVEKSVVAQWKKDIEDAERRRATKPEVMDIMGTRGDKPKTRSDVELDLVTGTSSTQTATVRWLMTGITLEEDQLHLQTFIHQQGRYPSRAEKIDVAGRRDRLRARIDRFHQDAAKYFDTTFLNYIDGDTPAIPFHQENQIGDPVIAVVSPPTAYGDSGGSNPERSKLALPSTLPTDFLQSRGLQTFRDQELALRRGQAHDALQAICLAIGQKSFQFTTNMRFVDPNASVTRPMAAIQTLGRTISAHRRVYARCRKAMEALDIPGPELITTYRVIEDSDVKTDTSIEAPNEPGAAREKLSWIFTVLRTHSSGPDYIQEYYRVHWLRARAHAKRWAEELELTRREMAWTTQFFLFKAKKWGEWQDIALNRLAGAPSIADRGAVAYAEREIAFWKSMAKRADNIFREVNRSYSSLI